MASQSESISVFVRQLREKQDRYKSRLAELVSKLTADNQDEKIKMVELTLEAANEMKAMLSPMDVPGWLNSSIEALLQFKNEERAAGSNHRLLIRLIDGYKEAINFRWMPQHFQQDSGIDFDKLYQKCKSESNIDNLFDEIIVLLLKIIESQDVDSIKIKNALEKLLATLKNHREKSYFNLVGSFDFLVSLFKNVLWEQLEAIPAIGPFVKGLRKTIEETNKGMIELHNKMKTEMSESYNTEVSFLTYKNTNLLE